MPRSVGFDASVDDDEVLLRLFREVDADGDGTISLEELLKAAGDSAGRGSERGAAIKAVFDAIGSSQQAVGSQEQDRTAAGEGEGGARVCTRADLDRFLPAEGAPANGIPLATALEKLATSLPADGHLDFLALKEAARKVPRVGAQRLEWERSMGLDAALARHLPPGTLCGSPRPAR